MRRTLAVAGISSALLVGGAAGVMLGNPLISGAQGTTTTTPTETAPAPGAPDGADHHAWMADALAPLVQAGTITQAQADAVVEALQAAHPAGGRGHGGMGPGGMGMGMGRGALGAGLDAAAKALNLTTDELRAQLQGGTSLGAVADAAGVDRQVVVDAIVAAAKERLATAVSEGRMTQAQADAKATDLAAEITEHLDDSFSGGPMGPMGGGRRGPGAGGATAPGGQGGSSGSGGSSSTTSA